MIVKDVISAAVAADQAAATAAAAVTSANQALATAQSARSTADGAVKDAIVKVGPVLTSDANGNPVVYVPDNSDTGYHSFIPVPDTTSLD